MKRFFSLLVVICSFFSITLFSTSCFIYEPTKDTKVTEEEWNKAFAFNYSNYQIDADFTPIDEKNETQEAHFEKDGDIMYLQLSNESEKYDYSVYAAKLGNDYKIYTQDETGVWQAIEQTKESYEEFHISTILKGLLGDLSYSSFTYDTTNCVYTYAQALPNGETAVTYTLGFLNNKIAEMNIASIIPITFTFMGMDVELEMGTLSCTFAYEDKDLILPSITSPDATDSKVTEEEWRNALTLMDDQNVQVEVLQNDASLGRCIKDGNIFYIFEAIGDFRENEETYYEVDEHGNVLKEYYKDDIGAWRMRDYEHSDYAAPELGLITPLNLGNADYTLFSYDEEEGIYSYTGSLGMGSIDGTTNNDALNNEPEISLRFLDNKLVELFIVATGSEKVVYKYSYNVINLVLPTVD